MRPKTGYLLSFGLAMTTLVAFPTLKIVTADGPQSENLIPKGPSFRVETEVFVGDKVQPAARHLILFDSGVIYDFRLDDDRFVTMFDPVRGRVVMVDRRQQQQTSVATANMLQATAQLRAAVVQEGKADKFGLNAVVTPATTANPGDISAFEISFGDTLYRTTTQNVASPEIARAYNHFATLASQLNVVQAFGAPPFARMTLGQHLADAGLLPQETTLEVRRGILKDRWKSQLLVVEQLSMLDKNRIGEFGKLLINCKEVELTEFGK